MGKKQKEPSKLTRWAMEAKAAGMKYGDWVAKYHPPGSPSDDPPVPAKICPHCGRAFYTTYGNKIYCTPDCTYAAREERKREERRCRKEKEETCSTTS